MTYIKRMVMHGFKSFANKTEINFDKGINVVIGPNGSGKSNISDALCFVLGRISTKSIRAAKAKNLLFMGSKYIKPAREAYVELAFDNTDRTFAIDVDEVVLSRIVKHNGISVYKINDEVKTRGDIIEALAQAGIDPHGFNLVLQGQIQSVVRMHPEDRRKVVEEVAGISIYETRKEKSLHELEKTEEKLREINAILRERTAFLRNLENERSQALKFKELEVTIKRCKASLLHRRREDKERELGSIRKSIDDKVSQKDKMRVKSDEMQKHIEELNQRIAQINKHIQHSTGIEQEKLHTQIANLKAELEGLRVRKESYEHRRVEITRRIEEMSNLLPEYEKEIASLREESPLVAKKQAELVKKKEELKKIEEERKKVYALKSELIALKDRIKDKESQLNRSTGESDAVVRQLEDYARTLKYPEMVACKKAIDELTSSLKESRIHLETCESEKVSFAKEAASAETEIKSAERIKKQINELDVCPLCRNKVTEEHVKNVHHELDEQVQKANHILKVHAEKSSKLDERRAALQATIQTLQQSLSDAERELSRHHFIEDKKSYLKKLLEHEATIKSELKALSAKRDSSQQQSFDSSHYEEQYASKLMEIEEISSRTGEDVDQVLSYKEREMEKMREVIKLSKKDSQEIEVEITEFAHAMKSKNELLEVKEQEERELNERFKKLFKERDEIQEEIQKESYESSTLQSEWRQVEDQVNYLKVGNAKLEAEKEAIEMELSEFQGLEVIKASVRELEERLQKSQTTMQTIGSINMRALEIYEEIKQEYDRVQEKVTTLQKEKEEIIKIIEEIDNKKKRTFMKTFNQINELFSNNFARLSTKGQAFLDIENKEDMFAGGVSIVIRMSKGKYFDVTSLSGGEQTLVALSLLFAIQEYKPYHFYVFDEIDAALDKRNSERLSGLLKQYMKSGQYITITHNDAIITESNVLYGVSMHDGVSKILSLNLGEKPTLTIESPPSKPDETVSAQPELS